MKKVIIVLMITLSCCKPASQEFVSITGFNYVLTQLNKSNIDEYLLKQNFEFKQQYVEPVDQTYFPKPVRHLYIDTVSKITVGVAYFANKIFEIRMATNDHSIYLKLKEQVKAENFVVKGTSENDGITSIQYSKNGTTKYITFQQRSSQYKNKYLVIYTDAKIGSDAAKSVLEQSGKDADPINPIPADSSLEQNVDTAIAEPQSQLLIKKPFKIFKFTPIDLYPSDNGAKLDSTRIVINGKIKSVNLDEGKMNVISSTGESMIIQFYPGDASNSAINQFKSAFKEGNTIKSTCAVTDAMTYDLYTASIFQ